MRVHEFMATVPIPPFCCVYLRRRIHCHLLKNKIHLFSHLPNTISSRLYNMLHDQKCTWEMGPKQEETKKKTLKIKFRKILHIYCHVCQLIQVSISLEPSSSSPFSSLFHLYVLRVCDEIELFQLQSMEWRWPAAQRQSELNGYEWHCIRIAVAVTATTARATLICVAFSTFIIIIMIIFCHSGISTVYTFSIVSLKILYK